MSTTATTTLPGIDAHPHARAVLTPAIAPAGRASHAYLFHGPAGTGKRTVARAFVAALLADGARMASMARASAAQAKLDAAQVIAGEVLAAAGAGGAQ